MVDVPPCRRVRCGHFIAVQQVVGKARPGQRRAAGMPFATPDCETRFAAGRYFQIAARVLVVRRSGSSDNLQPTVSAMQELVARFNAWPLHYSDHPSDYGHAFDWLNRTPYHGDPDGPKSFRRWNRGDGLQSLLQSTRGVVVGRRDPQRSLSVAHHGY